MISSNKSKVFTTDKGLIILGIIVITIVFSPYLYWGEDTYVRIHDNLDSNVVWVKMILDQEGLLGSPTAIIQQPMDGLPRSSVYGSYDISMVFFYLFGTFWGYVFNKFLMAVVGFIGMYFLLKKHFSPTNGPLYISAGVGLCFGLLPFWSFTMSVSGLPLLLYAFLNIRKKDYRIVNWVIIILLGFYSSLVLTGLFFLSIMLIVLIRDTIKYKRINIPFIGAMTLLSIAYLTSHLPLVISHLNENFVSHRTEFQSTFEYTTQVAFKRVWTILRKGDGAYLGYSHATSLHKFIMIPMILAIILMIINKVKNRSFIFILLAIVIASFLFGFIEWNGIAPIKSKLYSIFPLDLKRIYWLLPLWWYILMGISLTTIYQYIPKLGKYLVIIFIIFQAGYVIKYQDYLTEKRKIPTFREFFARKQFDDVKSFIGQDQKTYRVISIAIHPSISQYNGFYTLDGFSPDYPLEYKHKFKKIIYQEIKRDKETCEHFCGWGSWCYPYSGELGLYSYVDYKLLKDIGYLNFDYNALKSMGGEYIISAVKINTGNNPDLKLLKAFEKDNYKEGTTNWNIYLYEVLPQPSAFENNTGAEPINNDTQ